jgi:diguanylate cyclase (GGDEF)-like protein/PAS domain S-box-containing protein
VAHPPLPFPTRLPTSGKEARVVVSLAGLIAAASVIIAAAVYFGSLRQDSLQRASEERIVAQSVRGVVRAVATNARDYGWWDDAVRYLLLTPDAAWADTNIGPYVHTAFGYEVSLVLDGDGRPLLGWLDGLRATEAAADVLGPGLPALLAAARRQDGAEPATASAVLESRQGLFAAAASPVVPQAGSDLAPPPGPPALLLFAKRLDARFLAGLEADFGLRGVRFTAPGSGRAALGRVALQGSAGETVREIVWKPQRPGRSQLAWLVPVLLGSLAVLGGFTRLVLGSVRQSTAAIRLSEARFRDIAEAASDWIWETGPDLRLTFVSEHFSRATGLQAHEVTGRPLHAILELPPDPDQQERQRSILAAGRPFRDVLCLLRTESPETRTLRVAGRPVHDAQGALLGYRGIATDITAEMAALDQVRFMAEHDALTGLPNRLVLRDRLEEMLLRLHRYGEASAVLCLDLDRFKEVNDSLGHAAGDQLLVACAQRLRACLRETDLVARLGGDEFAVLQTDVGQPADVNRLCERILAALAEPFQIEDTEVVISGSIGVALVPADGRDAAQLMQKADIALYRAKEDGRGRACFFETGMDERLRERKFLEASLRHALTSGQLEVHYQPQVDAGSAMITGVEALLRWRHPTRGLVPPAEFVPVAEEAGLIVPIGDWVLCTACSDAVRWPGIRVSVNISPVQFRQRGLVQAVQQALALSGLEPWRLELEITEGLLIQNAAEALGILAQLKALGVAIAMDDFGTGYSSLSYLQKFPFDKIKIDRSFVGRLDEDAGNAAIVRAIVGLGRSFGISICAEGVETEAQLEVLRREGCEQAQGYLFGRAMEVGAIDGLVREAAHTTPDSPSPRAPCIGQRPSAGGREALASACQAPG